MEVRSWEVAQDLPAFDARGPMRDEREELVALLSSLSSSQWMSPTACVGWDVHAVALHLLGNDIGRLSAGRDGWVRGRSEAPSEFGALAAKIEQSNEEWVRGTRRISPRLLVDLLSIAGHQTDAHLANVDLLGAGTAVAWTGTGPSPMWLDIAREYTERWVHQQQIREAVGEPILAERKWLHPVLDTFMRALPRAYAEVDAPEGTSVGVEVVGDAGGRWIVRRGRGRWHLSYSGGSPAAEVQVPEDVVWRLLTRLISVAEAAPHIRSRGPRALAEPATRAVAIMTTKI